MPVTAAAATHASNVSAAARPRLVIAVNKISTARKIKANSVVIKRHAVAAAKAYQYWRRRCATARQ